MARPFFISTIRAGEPAPLFARARFVRKRPPRRAAPALNEPTREKVKIARNAA